ERGAGMDLGVAVESRSAMSSTSPSCHRAARDGRLVPSTISETLDLRLLAAGVGHDRLAGGVVALDLHAAETTEGRVSHLGRGGLEAAQRRAGGTVAARRHLVELGLVRTTLVSVDEGLAVSHGVERHAEGEVSREVTVLLLRRDVAQLLRHALAEAIG